MDQFLILLHAIFGGLALLSGSIAIATKKGKRPHKVSGKVFYYGMSISTILSLGIALLPNHFNPFLFSIGVFTLYFLIGGFRSLNYKKSTSQLSIDKITSWSMLLCAVGMITIPLVTQGKLDVVLAVFGGVSMAFAIRDLRLYQNPEKLGKAWLRLHLSKMSGAYIASVTAFLVVNQFLPYFLNWFLPTILGSIFIAFWMRKIRISSTKSIHLLALVTLCWFSDINAQVYTEKQTRHRFAQMNLGFDYQRSIGGQSSFLNQQGERIPFDLKSASKSRFIIGGTHFWGHADIYIAIPLIEPVTKTMGQELYYSSGVETVFKYYPWRIENRKIRPFVGFGIAPFFFIQDHPTGQGDGPEMVHPNLPILTGLTFNAKQLLFEIGLNYNHSNQIPYYISRTQEVNIDTPPLYLNFSTRYLFDTSISAEKDWESGRTEQITSKLAREGKLNDFYLGMGMSSAWWLGNSTYNELSRPFLPGYGISLMLDFGLGYYLHQPDINLALSYRSYGAGSRTYGNIQSLTRRSIGIEATKYLLDYHGFAPFIGPVISYEDLSFTEQSVSLDITQEQQQKWTYGITFGWDIRPNRLQSFLLRTNLRYYPNLNLEITEGQLINFNAIEFNFIQLVVFPGRMV